MPACPRDQIISANESGIYHCYNRCVRRAFLCGFDSATGKSYAQKAQKLTCTPFTHLHQSEVASNRRGLINW